MIFGLTFPAKHLQPIIATNYGAGEWARNRGIRRMSYLTIIVMGLILLMSGILCPLGIYGVFMEVGVDVDQLAQCAIRTCFTAFLPMVKTVVLVVSILFLTVIDPKRLRTSNYCYCLICIKRGEKICWYRQIFSPPVDKWVS